MQIGALPMRKHFLPIPPTTALLRITLLGHFCIDYYDGTAWRHIDHSYLQQSCIRLLLGFLTRCSERIASVEQITNALSLNEDENEATLQLQQIVNEFHKAIAFCLPMSSAHVSIISCDNKTLRIAEQSVVWVDVDAFEHLLDQSYQAGNQQYQQGLLEAALQLYTDDFLCEESELESLLPQRVSLRWQALFGLAKLAKLYKDTGKLKEAAQVYQKWMTFSYLEEEVYKDIVATFMLLDKCEEALRVANFFFTNYFMSLKSASSTLE